MRSQRLEAERQACSGGGRYYQRQACPANAAYALPLTLPAATPALLMLTQCVNPASHNPALNIRSADGTRRRCSTRWRWSCRASGTEVV